MLNNFHCGTRFMELETCFKLFNNTGLTITGPDVDTICYNNSVRIVQGVLKTFLALEGFELPIIGLLYLHQLFVNF